MSGAPASPVVSYKPKDLLNFAKAAPQALLDIEKPSYCPICFASFALDLDECGDVVDELRKRHPDFWDACNKMITVSRSDPEIHQLIRHLCALEIACPERQRHSEFRTYLRDTWYIFLDGLYICMHACMFRGSRPMLAEVMPKRDFFHHARGWWPSSPEQLFPSGVRHCIDVHATWCSELFATTPFYILSFLLTIARPLVLPHLLSPDIKRRVVWSMVQMLHASSSKPVAHWPGEPAGSPLPQALRVDYTVVSATKLLAVLHEGPDATGQDAEQFTDGYEPTLFQAVQAGLDGVTDSDESEGSLHLLCIFAMGLHVQLGPDNVAIDPRVTQYFKTAKRPRTEYGDDISAVIHRSFVRRAEARSCAGPGCKKFMMLEDTVFKQCSGCKLTRYCSRECQKADWRQEPPLGHKILCPIWCKLFAAGANKNMLEDEFLQAFRRASLVQEEKSPLLARALYEGVKNGRLQTALNVMAQTSEA